MRRVSEGRGAAATRAVESPLERLRGKYRDPKLTYDEVEGASESLLARELRADRRP